MRKMIVDQPSVPRPAPEPREDPTPPEPVPRPVPRPTKGLSKWEEEKKKLRQWNTSLPKIVTNLLETKSKLVGKTRAKSVLTAVQICHSEAAKLAREINQAAVKPEDKMPLSEVNKFCKSAQTIKDRKMKLETEAKPHLK